MAKLYENVFKAKFTLYAREYDTETDTSELKAVKYVPSIYIHSREETPYKSIITKDFLKKIDFKVLKDFKDQVKIMTSSGVRVYGNKSEEQGYIRDTYGDPTQNDHNFRTLFLDIETAILDTSLPKAITKDDWKPEGERGAMATITSIQMYDTKNKEFYILGLNKDWDNTNNFTSEHGKIRYIRRDTEEELLKTFLILLDKLNPTVIAGWNSEGYDYPYLTMRIMRVLDKRDDLFAYDKKLREWVFNRDLLSCGYVSQLSPVGMITYKAQETNYGTMHTFQWVGYILEDYLDLYKKYTYTTLTSYSLDSVAGHELGNNKVNHDEFSDFAEFYRKDFNTFIEYGIQDVGLLYELDNKLKLIDLAKYLAYYCGVTMNDVRGTIKQWNSYMFNETAKNGDLLPLNNEFPEKDTVLLEYACSDKYDGPRKDEYKRLLNYVDPETGQYSLQGQRFPGGWTRGTARFWKWVFSLDYTSLYPSAQMWANIGIDTLIEPKDLHPELLALRAEYFIYYPKDLDPKTLEQLDYEFIRRVLDKPEVREHVRSVLVKHNVSATPNGMFFTKSKRSTMSTIIENLIVERKKYKKSMKTTEQEIENLKVEKDKGGDAKVIDAQIFEKQQLRDKYDVYQMGIKIFLNSNYGSQSMKSNVFAGHPEYFSSAITSTSRIANIFITQEQSKKIDSIVGVEAKEMRYGHHIYMDNCAQADTDSCYMSLQKVVEKKFGANYEEEVERERLIEFTQNYIDKVAMPVVRDKLDNIYAYTLNAYLPEKLQEDPEVICDNFISIAPKMYFARKYWDEGVTLAKPKLKITGLSTVRSNTPKFYRQELSKAMDILIDGDVPKVIEYIEKVRSETRQQKPEDIAINQGVSSLDYQWDENLKKFRRWTGEKFLGAPVNSRACLTHNKFIEDKEITNIKSIEAGDKISFLYMNTPNPLHSSSNALGFRDTRLFDHGLKEYIDYDTMFAKGFYQPISLITGPLGWDLTPKDEQIQDDEW